MKTVVAVIMLVALLAASQVALAQDQSTPKNVVNLFKTYLDEGNTRDVLPLCTDLDIDGPLQPSNYWRLSDPMQTYVSGWAKQTFSLEKSVELSPSWVVVFVNSPDTQEQVKFYTKCFGDKWYVDDIEVYNTK